MLRKLTCKSISLLIKLIRFPVDCICFEHVYEVWVTYFVGLCSRITLVL